MTKTRKLKLGWKLYDFSGYTPIWENVYSKMKKNDNLRNALKESNNVTIKLHSDFCGKCLESGTLAEDPSGAFILYSMYRKDGCGTLSSRRLVKRDREIFGYPISWIRDGGIVDIDVMLKNMARCHNSKKVRL